MTKPAFAADSVTASVSSGYAIVVSDVPGDDTSSPALEQGEIAVTPERRGGSR